MCHGPETLPNIARVRNITVCCVEECADSHTIPGITEARVGRHLGFAFIDALEDTITRGLGWGWGRRITVMGAHGFCEEGGEGS